MSQNESAASDRAHDGQESGSVYDFLYHDVRRVGSFLSQFDDAGLLQQITQSEGAHRGGRRGWKASAGGSLPGLGSANIALEKGPEKGGYEASDRVYDPLWANALALLEFLDERGMFIRELENARLGQFVLVRGSLSILGLKLFRGLWDIPLLRKMLMANIEGQAPSGPEGPSNRTGRRATQAAGARGSSALKTQTETNLEAGLSVVGMLPHVIHALITQPAGACAWGSLTEDGLVSSAADIVLKHGTAVSGEWTVLGVVDALPDVDAYGQLTESGTTTARQALQSDSMYGVLMAHMMPHIRPILGRPLKAYGITPLLILREITG